MLRFHARQEASQRFAQPLLPIKSEDRALDDSGHEEKRPSCCLNFPLERGMSDFDRCPSRMVKESSGSGVIPQQAAEAFAAANGLAAGG